MKIHSLLWPVLLRRAGSKKGSQSHPVGKALHDLANSTGGKVFTERCQPSNSDDVINVTFAAAVKFKDIYPELQNLKNVFYLDLGPFAGTQKLNKFDTFRLCYDHPGNTGLVGSYDDKRNYIYNDHFKVKNYRQGKNILVLTQHNTSFMFPRDVNHFEWTETLVSKLKQCTDRPIIVRPHQRSKVELNQWKKIEQKNVSLSPSYLSNKKTIESNIQHDLENAHAAVTFNSGSITDALLDGVVGYSFDIKCIGWDACYNELDLDSIDSNDGIDRDQWLQKMAYASWFPSDFLNGNAYKYLCNSYETVLGASK